MTGILSSVSAIVLAQPGSQIAEAVLVVGAAAAVGGFIVGKAIVQITHKEWKAYKEKQHKEKIEAVNKIHKQTLCNLTISNGTPIPALPQIFQFKEDNKTVESLHYNQDELDDIGVVPPEAPLELTPYWQYILDAILKLKAYYNDLADKDDITAGVLSYLLNILQNRCLSFAGYEYDITYLHALISFVNNYASMENTEHSQHFSRLMDVYTPLKYAVQELEKHKESMSFKDMVEEARNACLDTNNQLIRLMVRIIMPEKYDHLIDTVTHTELKQDIIRKKYVDKEKWGIIFKSKPEIDLPNSIFHDWIMGLSHYFLEAQNPSDIIKGQPIIRPNELFAFINWAREVKAHPLPEKTNNPRYQEEKKQYDKDRKKLHETLNLIYKVFTHAPCFVNSKLSSSKKKDEFVVVKEENELLIAVEFIAQFGHLIHGIISLQGLCTELSKSIQELGLDFFDNQQNFDRMLTAFNELKAIIQADLNNMEEKMLAIDKANKNVMRIAYKIELQNQMEKALKAVRSRLLYLADKVTHYKNKYPKTQEESIQEILSAADFFSRIYKESPSLPTKSTTDSTIPLPEQKTNQQIPATNPVHYSTENAVMEVPTLEEMKTKLNEINNELLAEVTKINDSREKDPQEQKYETICNSLKDLQMKSIEMSEEIEKQVQAQKEPDPDRVDKAQKLYKFTLSIYESTIAFLAQIPEERAKQVDSFIEKMHKQLNSRENNAFIDRHYNGFSKWIQDNFGFFPTATRKKITALEYACENLRP
ncbi:hypothetical protein [Legionella fallonii]|uniref:Uncharacterized protein n=1 Tax=Legionella fallonii LLAP-10 TaxID=1212491 RepID=A0A098G207_9GAMM|nr:hypothetical protein [Legionella fallonii]CEG56512.1 conserved exported protein of unknown function [Legionella fallonii LLAP-10]